MAIRIIDENPGSDVYLTANDHARLQSEYQRAFMFYSGVPPTFESWVRGKQGTLLNETNDQQLELKF